MLVINQAGSIIKEGIDYKLVFKTKGPYIVMETATPRLYWIQHFPFCNGLWKPKRKLKEPEARVKNIPSAMVLHNHVDGVDTRFSTM